VIANDSQTPTAGPGKAVAARVGVLDRIAVGGDTRTKLAYTVLATAANVADRGALPYLLHGKETRVRAKVGHVFGVIKNIFGFRKTRCRGLAKNLRRLEVTAALANLYIVRRRLLNAQETCRWALGNARLERENRQATARLRRLEPCSAAGAALARRLCRLGGVARSPCRARCARRGASRLAL